MTMKLSGRVCAPCSKTSGLTIVGEASTAGEAVPRIVATRPDVAVLDVQLPDGTGVDVCREVRSRRARDRVPHAHQLR